MSDYENRPWIEHYDYWVRPHLNYPRRPLHEILRIAAVEVPDRPATAFLGAHLNFAEIKERADRLATALARRGILKGDRVGIMLPNCPQYIIATFAILRIGRTVMNVNPLFTRGSISSWRDGRENVPPSTPWKASLANRVFKEEKDVEECKHLCQYPVPYDVRYGLFSDDERVALLRNWRTVR